MNGVPNTAYQVKDVGKVETKASANRKRYKKYLFNHGISGEHRTR
jgi:hypothetical protein